MRDFAVGVEHALFVALLRWIACNVAAWAKNSGSLARRTGSASQGRRA